jgi:hypothetical protein
MARIMLAAVLLCSYLASSNALDMNTAVDTKDKFVYMNLWGKIEHGDDQKFRSILLPLIRAGDILFKVNLFTIGGDVQAAMGIGDQIRTAKGMTVAPMKMATFVDRRAVSTGTVQCWFFAASGGIVAAGMNNGIFEKNIRTNAGSTWCDCASACFLIWSSGLARTGQWVGIHRFRFDETFFGKLPAAEAERLYQSAENQETGYLKKLDVPDSIIERLYATPSTSMYYLSQKELELAESTPYLEELVLARCGSAKDQTYWQGNTYNYKQDEKHVECTRSVLKEIETDGAKDYLAKYNQ